MGIVEEYLEHVSEHRLESALACLAPGFTLTFKGSAHRLDKAQVAAALGWDVGANGRLSWMAVERSGSRVVIEGTEGNEFLDLIGLGPLPFRSVFSVDADGSISGQEHDVDWSGRDMAAALAPLLDWAGAHAPDELAEIHPDGRMVYSRPMAERWVALARRWKERTRSELSR